MVMYHQLGDFILNPEGEAAPGAPLARQSRWLRVAYDFQREHGSAAAAPFLEAIGALPYVEPALLRLGDGDSGVGVAGTSRGFLDGMHDDYMHFGPLGIIKMLQTLTSLYIIDCWGTKAQGQAAVRLFELRLGDVPSFSDGIAKRRGFLNGYLAETLTASDREDLLTVFVCGIGDDLRVIPNAAIKLEYLRMLDDLVFVIFTALSLSVSNVTFANMQKANYRFVDCASVTCAYPQDIGLFLIYFNRSLADSA
jgi:hypothetical protein